MKIGITGSIGTGKSMVSRYLKANGYAVIDADETTQNIYRLKKTENDLIALFGDRVVEEGAFSRKKLGELVFRNPEALHSLNAYFHPLIEQEMNKSYDSTAKSQDLIFFDIPLLIEVGYHQKLDKVIVITCDESLQMQRIMKRDGSERELTLQKIRSQMPQEQKRMFADYIIDNNGTVEQLYQQVDQIIAKLKSERNKINLKNI